MNFIKQYAVIAVVLLSTLSFSQSKGTSELNISLGAATLEDFRTATESVANSLITVVISGDQLTHADGSSMMGYTASYNYAIQDQWMFGVALAYQNVEGKLLLNGSASGKSSSKVYSLGIETDYRYISKSNFQIYSGLGLGYAFGKTTFDLGNKLELKDKNNNNSKINYFTFHVTAVGFRVGKKLAAFAELGFGYKGIINGGLSYQF